APNYLRFDFSHFAKVTDEELQQVENFVNQRIQEQLPLIEKRSIPFQQAIEEGAMALFGEKYGDNVRAIRFGESIELCGGTHVKNTADIWHFKITSEGAVAAGIRRIEAISGNGVKEYFRNQEQLLSEVKQTLKNPQDIIKSVHSLQDENAKLKKEVEQLLKDKIASLKKEYSSKIQELNGVNYLSAKLDGLDAKGAKDLAYELEKTHPFLFVIFGTVTDNEPTLTSFISKSLVKDKGINANDILKEVEGIINGKGGGQPFLA